MKTTLTTPTVHMNGTGFKTLTEDYDRTAHALQDFINAWRSMEFNARDYYVQGPEAWSKAHDERMAINAKIKEIGDYLDAHREAIYDQEPPRQRVAAAMAVASAAEFSDDAAETRTHPTP